MGGSGFVEGGARLVYHDALEVSTCDRGRALTLEVNAI